MGTLKKVYTTVCIEVTRKDVAEKIKWLRINCQNLTELMYQLILNYKTEDLSKTLQIKNKLIIFALINAVFLMGFLSQDLIYLIPLNLPLAARIWRIINDR